MSPWEIKYTTLSAPNSFLLCYYYWNEEAKKDDLQLNHIRFEGIACRTDDTDYTQKHTSLGAALVYDLKKKRVVHIF